MVFVVALTACHAPPRTVDLTLARGATLRDLVDLADRLAPGSVEVDDSDALAHQPILLRSDRAVPVDTALLAVEVALEINGWEVTRTDGTFRGEAPPARPPGLQRISAKATPELWFGSNRAVALWDVEGVSREKLVAVLGGGIEVAPDGRTLVYGDDASGVDAIRRSVEAVEAHPAILEREETLLCPSNLGPPGERPSAWRRARTVHLNFPDDASLLTAAKFFCDMVGYAVLVDVDALEGDRFDHRIDVAVTPDEAAQVYELALKLHGWSLVPGDPASALVRTGARWRKGHGVPVVDRVALDGLDSGTATRAIAASPYGKRVQVAVGTDQLFVGGSETAVTGARDAVKALRPP